VLDSWARQQDETPWFRFSTDGSAGSDPGEETEAVGDADAIKSTALGLKNLQRVSKMLVPATTSEKGANYDDLSEIYGRMLGQWATEMNHVTNIVGGFNSQERHIGQIGPRFTPVPAAHQREAVKFLNENAFTTPIWAIDKDIVRKIEPMGTLNRIRNAQDRVLNSLLSSAKFARLTEQNALDGKESYQAGDFLADVRKGVWGELDMPKPEIDAYRRNLQRAYLDLANNKLNAAPPALPQGAPPGFAALLVTSGDERGYYRAELRMLQSEITRAIPRTADRATRVHLEATRDEINRILNPDKDGVERATTSAGRRALELMELYDPTSCWPDYEIKP
jgi:hypothetical protein